MEEQQDTLSEVICNPEISNWEISLTENETNRNSWNNTLPSQADLCSLRAGVLKAAHQFTEQLCDIARQHEMGDEPQLSSAAPSGSELVLMAGHQPNLHHPGVLQKNLLLTEFLGSRETKDSGPVYLGINVLIDLDQEDIGYLAYPSLIENITSVRSFSLSDGANLIPFQTVKSVEELKEGFGEIMRSLETLQKNFTRDSFATFSSNAQKLSGVPTLQANTLMRRIFEGHPPYLDVPLSELIAFPEARNFFSQLIGDGAQFHALYNRVLGEHRKKRKIKNPANPFPDLRVIESRIELPFWILCKENCTRESLFIQPDADRIQLFVGDENLGSLELDSRQEFYNLLGDKRMLVPKGSLITIFLRLLCSDLFIHGLGGARYDVFTDSFIREYFGVEPPSFVTASRTTYLFEDELAAHRRAVARKDELRNVYSHVEDYFDREFFGAAEVERLRELTQQKQSLIEQVKQARAEKVATAELSAQIKLCNEEIRTVVDEQIGHRWLAEAEIPAATLHAYEFREYPYFFFGEELLKWK